MAVGGTRQKLSMIAAVTNQGKVRWMAIDGRLQSRAFEQAAAVAHMTALQAKPERIQSFFQDPLVKYAA